MDEDMAGGPGLGRDIQNDYVCSIRSLESEIVDQENVDIGDWPQDGIRRRVTDPELEPPFPDSPLPLPPNDDDRSNIIRYFSPLLRPGSMVMMTLTKTDYEMHYWPKLKTAIDQLLNMRPMSYIPISYEQMYSCVYKCVCKQFSERLYNDLTQHMALHMDHLNQQLKSHESDAREFISSFSFLMHQYLHALSGIVPIFNYMNRFYVENKLKTDLNEELRKLFRVQVVDTNIDVLIKLLDEASRIPFAVPPHTMASIIKNLYDLNENYSKLNPGLFSRYLPNILPASDPSLLEQYAMEAKNVQSLITSLQDTQNHNSGRKRELEEDMLGN